MKKTTLTVTDSTNVPDVPGSSRETPEQQNAALRLIVEQQEIAMEMIMTKYRQQVTNLSKVSSLDATKLHYKRYLDTIVNQSKKMEKMTTTMRKNLLIVFKYEEILQQIEYENEGLRALVRKLTSSAEDKKLSAHVRKLVVDAGSQTNLHGSSMYSTEDKSVGTTMTDSENRVGNDDLKRPDKEGECMEMMMCTPFSDSFAFLGTAHNTIPPTKPLDVDAAFDLYVNRFNEEAKKVTSESKSLSNITLSELDAISPLDVDADKIEDSSPSATGVFLMDEDEMSSENSIVSLIEDDHLSQEATNDAS